MCSMTARQFSTWSKGEFVINEILTWVNHVALAVPVLEKAAARYRESPSFDASGIAGAWRRCRVRDDRQHQDRAA